jgi:hypothetical protein
MIHNVDIIFDQEKKRIESKQMTRRWSRSVSHHINCLPYSVLRFDLFPPNTHQLYPTGGIQRRHVEGSRNCGSYTCSFKSHQRKKEQSRERQIRTCKRLADCNERNNKVDTELQHHKIKSSKHSAASTGRTPRSTKNSVRVTKPEDGHFVT